MGFILIGNQNKIAGNPLIKTFYDINFNFAGNRTATNCGIADGLLYLKDHSDSDFVAFFSNTTALSLVQSEEKDICHYKMDVILDSLGLTQDGIKEQLKKTKAIIPNLVSLPMSVREHLGKKNGIDFSRLETAVYNTSPSFSDDLKSVLNGDLIYEVHGFILEKNSFDSFIDFSIPVLLKLYDDLKSNVSVFELANMDIIAAILLQVFMRRMPDSECFYACKKKVIFPSDVELNKKLGENDVSIVMATSEKYILAGATLIQSIYENGDPQKQYNISVFYNNISNNSMLSVMRMVSPMENVNVEFVNMDNYFRAAKLPTCAWFTYEIYFRIAAMEVLTNVSKTLYIDVDMIAESDVAELFDTDINGYLLAATRDADTAGIYNGYHSYRKGYTHDILHLDDPFKYFQAGIILFNLDEFRKEFTFQQLLDFSASYPWKLCDQDVLNVLCKDRVKYIDMSWNVLVDTDGKRIPLIIKRAPHFLYEEYMEARNHPKILHFAGGMKPWFYPEMEFAERFWYYARKCVLYERILARLTSNQTESKLRKRSSGSKNGTKKESFFRRLANKLLPKGSKRRELIKKIVKRG